MTITTLSLQVIIILGSVVIGFVIGAIFSWVWRANAKVWRDSACAWRSLAETQRT